MKVANLPFHNKPTFSLYTLHFVQLYGSVQLLLRAEMSQLSDLFVGGVFNNTLCVEETVIVNWNMDHSFMVFTVPVFLATLLLNSFVLMILWPVENTIVNQLIVLDSINDITFSSLCTFHQSPFYQGLGLESYCYVHLVIYWTCVMCNRLIPVSIALYR